MKTPCIAIGALALSAAGDRPTVGFGSTFRDDGSLL